jgi:hypothetical protein
MAIVGWEWRGMNGKGEERGRETTGSYTVGVEYMSLVALITIQ